MRLLASLSRDETLDFLRKFVPLEIELAKEGKGQRFFAIDELREVTLVPGLGVRLEGAARVRWPLLGLHVPVRAKSLVVLLRPEVVTRVGHPSLALSLSVERADIAWSPTLVNDSVVERVNEELLAHRAEVAWNFAKTLSHVFRLPDAVTSAATIGLEVAGGEFTVSEASIEFAVAFRAAVGGRDRG